ncbi:MAG: D-2-hydroxyacid dehydrogenase, partial [Clostridia bacterium]
MKTVILDGYTENPGDLDWKDIHAPGKLTVYDRTSLTDEEEIIRRIGDAEIVITNKTPITRHVLDACPGIRFISVLATGYNIIDTVCAAEKGIPVSNIPAYGTDAVAQFAIGLLLEVCHHIGHHSETVKQGRWSESPDFCYWDYPLIELKGKTMGIIGYGRIGSAVGRIASAFGMKVLAVKRHPKDDTLAEFTTLDDLYSRADVISLHCPLTTDNVGMINREAIAKMKDGVIIINNSRGPLIEENDLAQALKEGKVAAAAVDVVSREPIKADNPLLMAPNCLITPHISWAPKESRQRIMEGTAQNICAFLSGKPINVV